MGHDGTDAAQRAERGPDSIFEVCKSGAVYCNKQQLLRLNKSRKGAGRSLT